MDMKTKTTKGLLLINVSFLERFFMVTLLFFLLYVDDILTVEKKIFGIDNLKKQLDKSLSMKDMGAAKKIIGTSISLGRT